MDGLTDMYDQQYSGIDAHTGMHEFSQDGLSASPMDTAMLDSTHMQTLDQIISQNNQELLRRRQTVHQQPQYRSMSVQEHARRASMMEFSSNGNSDLADFQFDPNPVHAAMSSQMASNISRPQPKLDPRRVRSREELTLDTRFSNNYGSMNTASSYPPSMLSSAPLAIDGTSSYMDGNVDFDDVSANIANMNMQNNSAQQNIYSTSPVSQNFPLTYGASNTDPGGGNGSTPRSGSGVIGINQSGGSTPQQLMTKQQAQLRRNPMMPSPLSISQGPQMSTMVSPARAQQSHSRRQSIEMQTPFPHNPDQNPMMEGPVPAAYSRFQSAYSSSGFDMLGVLMRVATRQKPDINIGPVDLSCAFVVCDIAKHDLPIVYCSDMFERLTGYSKYEILGRNCRFLQAPDGKVQSGTKRKYVDDKSVLYLKNQINKRAEAQLSLINYRKGGQPFMNLLTMIPISWDTEEFKYFVGFQVDLVEQPNSVSAKNPDGTYEINYNRSALPAYQLPQPDHSSAIHEFGQTIPRDEVSQVLSTIGNGESELSKRIWDKVLLENTDDVVHVLSLKGLFLYLSPASQKVLEYDPTELVGTALSSVCHPSDIVPVTRELKDASNGATVNVVYRIRRKNSGYTWFEAHGCLHTEQGKGRKCIILVGRQRPVYALNKNDTINDGGIGDSELWTKMSTSGMFLFVSTNSRPMLDQLPEDLIGTSMQALMRPDSKRELNRSLEVARNGEKSTFKHDLQNRRGQVLQAQTTIHPGDSRKGSKPTFLLAQTRLLKMTRAMLLSQQKSAGPTSTPRTDEMSVGSQTPFSRESTQIVSTLNHQNSSTSGASANSMMSAKSIVGDSGILTQAGGSGLPIGSQDEALASEDNIFDELKTTRSTSWQFELRQMEKQNRLLAEELQALLSRKKKRKRRRGLGQLEKDCANCHTRVTPEWRRGPSGNRDLCNSCGLRWAKQNGRVSPRGKASGQSDKSSTSPAHVSAQAETKETSASTTSKTPEKGAFVNSSSNIPPKVERETKSGSIPAAIEEHQEPPHLSVLPA